MANVVKNIKITLNNIINKIGDVNSLIGDNESLDNIETSLIDLNEGGGVE